MRHSVLGLLTRSTLLTLFAFALLVPRLTTTSAATCAGDTLCGYHSCGTPAKAAPPALWGELKPATTGTLPAQRDSTFFTQSGPFDNSNPYWMSLDVADGWIFAATNAGFEVWDARTAPGNPTRRANVDFYSAIPFWSENYETKYYIHDVAAATPELVATAIRDGAGLVVWDTSVRSGPRVLYQDHGATANHRYGYQVHTTTVGGRHYAFLAAENLDGGLFAYDLTAAQSLTTRPCVEARPSNPDARCNGVFLGKVGARTAASYVDGEGPYLAVSSGALRRGLELWDVTTPSAPARRLEALPGEVVYGVALWRQGARHLLAVRLPTEARIYDVSCLTAGSCGGLGSPLVTLPIGAEAARNFLTFSRSEGTPFLYLGSEDACSGGLQREWLLDVSNPAAPRDITPPPAFVDGALTGYWGWYYAGNPSGFNFVAPRVGKFSGRHFYRAGLALFDIHEREINDLIFTDGFEGGALSAWSGAETDGGDLAVTTAAAIFGSWGLVGRIDDTNSLYVVDETPASESRYRARFYLDPSGLTMTTNSRHKVFTLFSDSPRKRLVTFTLRRTAGGFALRTKVRLDDDSWHRSAWLELPTGATAVEIDWRRASSTAADGHLRTWIDGTLRDQLTGLGNSTWLADFLRLGAVGGLDATTGGSFTVDAFESRRINAIGTIP